MAFGRSLRREGRLLLLGGFGGLGFGSLRCKAKLGFVPREVTPNHQRGNLRDGDGHTTRTLAQFLADGLHALNFIGRKPHRYDLGFGRFFRHIEVLSLALTRKPQGCYVHGGLQWGP